MTQESCECLLRWDYVPGALSAGGWTTNKTHYGSHLVDEMESVNAASCNCIRVFPSSSVGKECPCNAGDPGLIPGSERSAGEEIGYPLQYSWASLVAQLVKNLPAMRETSTLRGLPLVACVRTVVPPACSRLASMDRVGISLGKTAWRKGSLGHHRD